MKIIISTNDTRTIEIADFGTQGKYVKLTVLNRKGEPLLDDNDPLIMEKKDLQRMAKGL